MTSVEPRGREQVPSRTQVGYYPRMHAKLLGTALLCAAIVVPSTARADEGSAQRTWGWVATGTGAAFLGVGTYALFKSRSAADDPTYDDYRKQSVPSGEDACDHARAMGRDDIVELCDGNEKWSTVFWITMPVGFVLTGTGIYLLATAPSKPGPAGWQLAPSTNARGGRLDLSYRF